MFSAELINYIRESRESGKTDEDIKIELIKVGWKDADVDEALASAINKSAPETPNPNMGITENVDSLSDNKNTNQKISSDSQPKKGSKGKVVAVIAVFIVIVLVGGTLYAFQKELIPFFK